VDLSPLTPQLLTSLPVDRRAIEILRAISAGESGRVHQNRTNIRLQLEQYHWQGTDWDAAQAYEEAFDWLAYNGLVTRDATQSGPDWFVITDRGRGVAESDTGLSRLRADQRLNVDLHPLIAERVRSQYLLGEWEAAALLAMREVEIRVRKFAGASDAEIGVALMKEAFKKGGPLSDPSLEAGEQQATMALFWGAIGVFKNPSSHRQVDFEDPTLASEVVLLADLLLRVLDRLEAAR
jgi:uncharacterized protein (TIGR02391 family)